MIRRLWPAFIAILALFFADPSSPVTADEPTAHRVKVESEFASVDEALATQKQLRILADNVASAVVKLSGTDDAERVHHGSGVVIHPSGLILTHGHHDLPKEAKMNVTFPDGQIVEAVIDSVFSGRGRDFSLLKIQKTGQYPAIGLRREKPVSVGERCFHFGFPGMLNEFAPHSTPVLRLGRIAGTGRSSTYANCLITSGDSGGPLFDFEGRLIGILDSSIGPDLRHPGVWADLSRILDGTTFLTDYDGEEIVRLGFTNRKRKAIDTQRHLANTLCPELLAPAHRATVEILVDGKLAILGTIVNSRGVVLTKRSEVMTHSGTLLGKITCRLFDGDEVLATAVADSHKDDIALLQLIKGTYAAALFSEHDEPRRGVIVLVPIPGNDVSETGVVGVDRSFKIQPRSGVVALPIESKEGGVTFTGGVRELDRDFTKLLRGSIQEGDVITHVNGEPTPDLSAYERHTQKDTFIAGDFIRLVIRRDEATSQVDVPIDNSVTEQNYTDHSLRLTGFPSVIVHDTIVERRQCGGPVVDLEGRIVGINIARLDRSSTFAIPQQRVQELVRELIGSSMR